MAVLSTLAIATATAAIAQEAQPSSPAFDDKLVCRKIKETGSLVKKKKMCFTQAEWDRLAEAEHKGVGRMVDELTGKAGGN